MIRHTATNLLNHVTNRYHIAIALSVLLIFLVGANQAWLNPKELASEDFVSPQMKIFKQIPFMWQYNTDAFLEFKSAAGFPAYFADTPIRTNRPLYPGLVRILGEMWGLLLRPFVSLGEGTIPESVRIAVSEQRAAAAATASGEPRPYDYGTLTKAFLGYVTLKLLVFVAFGLMSFHLFRRYTGDNAALLATLLMLGHSLSIRTISLYHTTELEFVTPLVTAFFLANLARSYSHGKNLWFSVVVGLLMLGKPNYGCYLAALAFALLNRRVMAAMLSVAGHAIPIAAWLVFLKLYGLSYYSHELQSARQGLWLVETFLFLSPLEMVKTLQSSVISYFELLSAFYAGFWIPVAAAGLAYVRFRTESLRRPTILFLALSFAGNWFQVFSAQRFIPYMTADVWFWIFGPSALLLVNGLAEGRPRRQIVIVAAVSLAWLSWNILGILNIPWVHPLNQ